MQVHYKAAQPFAKLNENCYICKKTLSKYVCPQCKVAYCSIQCYRTHNQNCTENFYMEHVKANLSQKKATQEETHRVKEILKRINDSRTQEVMTEQEEHRLLELKDKLEQGHGIEILSPLEKEQFFRDIEKGKLLGNLEEWTPWWTHPNPPHVDVQDPKYPFLENYLSLPLVSSLTSKTPSPELVYHIANTLWTVAYVWRTFNGDLDSNQAQGVFLVKHISDGLKPRKSVSSLQQAINQAHKKAKKYDPEISESYFDLVDSDLKAILQHKTYVVESLFKLYELLGPQPTQARHKVFFMLCYVKFYNNLVRFYVLDFLKDFTEFL